VARFLFVVFFCDRRFGDDFIVVLAMLFRMTNSDIEPLRIVTIIWYYMSKL